MNDQKEKFCAKYNPKHDSNEALNKGILASVQRGYLYTPNLTYDQKTEIYDFWRQTMFELGKKYCEEVQSIKVFCKDIKTLQDEMNKKFPDAFKNRHGKKGFVEEFRVAHAQKSFAIYLKHLWCLSESMPEPPSCPMDKNIFRIVGINDSWTKVNDIELYKQHYLRVKQYAETAGRTVACWELFSFNN